MDPNYHLDLWKALRLLRGKISSNLEHMAQPGSTPVLFSERRLARSREIFETGFLMILQNSSLDDEYCETISQSYPQRSREILQRIGELTRLLDKIVNQGFRPSSRGRSKFQTRGELAKLERLIQKLELSASPFELVSGSSNSVFKIDQGNAKSAEMAVMNLKAILGPIQITELPPRAPVSTPKESSVVPNWIESFDKEYGQFLQRVLDSFESAFENCDSESHKVFIQLLDAVSLEIAIPEDGLDIFLSCEKEQSGTWQNIRCHSSHLDTDPHRKSICEMVQTSLTRKEGLRVMVKDSEKSAPHFTKIFLPLRRPSLHPDETCRSLGCLIAEQKLFRPRRQQPALTFKFLERRTLIAKLAINLLVFSSFKHTSKSWDGESVTYLCSSMEELPRQSPYVSCLIGQDSRDDFCPEDDAARVDYLTQFAKLLLEIEYGELLEGDFSYENSYGHDVLREYHETQVEYGELGKERFLNAISTCLQFDMEFRRIKAQAELTRYNRRDDRTVDRSVNHEIFSNLVRMQIVHKLLQDLPQFRESVMKRDKSSLPQEPEEDDVPTISTLPRRRAPTVRFGPIHGQEDGSTSRDSCRSPHPRRINDASAPQQSSVPEVPQRNFGSLEGATIGSLFPGSRSSLGSQRPESAESAKDWFGELNHFITRMELGRRQDLARRVKVAVLDTGLDEGHAAIQGRLELHDSKICGKRSFIDHSSNINDVVGHGTAVCDILLRVARVDLFVAKISETANFDSDTTQRVAKAIDFASSKEHWDVDIMVLSFGFKEVDTAIEEAVKEAHRKGKIIFAAASNSGHVHQHHKRVSFPARMESSGAVISIRSISGQNTLSGFSARPGRSPPDWNFMTLGEGIKAAWSSVSSLGQQNPIKYVSGTSFATPLAAGIAACVLDFSTQVDVDSENFTERVAKKHRDTLWTCRGIRKILEEMADTTAGDGSRIIHPSELFNPNSAVTDAHYSSRIEELMVSVNEGR